jgi:hypothetical protein
MKMLSKIFYIQQICFGNYVRVLFLKYENMYLSQIVSLDSGKHAAAA